MTNKYSFIVLLCMMTQFAVAQKIHGIIKYASGVGIPYASIGVLNTGVGAIANKNGEFDLSLQEGSYQIAVFATGVAGLTQSLVVAKDRNTNVEISLQELSSSLGEVVVTADKIETQLQKTPMSVTALTSKEVTDYRVWTVSDLISMMHGT